MTPWDLLARNPSDDPDTRYLPEFVFVKFDGFVKSRPEGLFVNYHEEHQEREAEIIIYFLPLRVLRALRGKNQTFYDFIKFEWSKTYGHSLP